MSAFLMSLLPWSKREWSDFFADLAPLTGLIFFSEEPRKIMLPLYLELYFVFGYGLIRLISISFYTALQQGREMGLSDLSPPDSLLGKVFYLLFLLFFGSILFVAILCIISILIGFNLFFYLMIQLFLSIATTGGMDANSDFIKLYEGLTPKEQYYIWGMFLFTLYRYLPKVIYFFKNREYRNQKKSWSWLALGAAPIPKANQFQVMVKSFRKMIGSEGNSEGLLDSAGSIYFLFLIFYFTMLVLMIKLPMAGPILTLLIKAFAEMYFFRLYRETKNVSTTPKEGS